MKRFWSILLCLALILSLAACGEQAKETDSDETQTQPTEAATQTPGEETVPVPEETTAPTEEPEAPALEIEAEFPVVLVDDEVCFFAIEEAKLDPFWGYTLVVSMKNKTDVSQDFYVNSAAINGYVSEPAFFEELEAGASAEAEMIFTDDSYTWDGMEEVLKVSFLLEVSPTDDWLADPVLQQPCEFYPKGEAAAVFPERQLLDTDKVLYEDEYCAVILVKVDPEALFGYEMTLFLENKTDKALMFSFDAVTLNGKECDPYWADQVGPGLHGYSLVTWLEEEMEEAGIETVETMVLPLTVYDANDWLADYLVEETLTVEP